MENQKMKSEEIPVSITVPSKLASPVTNQVLTEKYSVRTKDNEISFQNTSQLLPSKYKKKDISI